MESEENKPSQETKHPLTVEDVFKNFKGRRAGIIKALTSDFEDFFIQSDPEKDNLCLYGLPTEEWEVNLPAEEVPPELPEPTLGINFARDGMQEQEWASLVACHSDSWLLAVASFFGSRYGFLKPDRRRLYNMINELPTVLEVVTGASKKKKTEKSSGPTNKNSNSKVKTLETQPKFTKPDQKSEEEGLSTDEDEDPDEDDEEEEKEDTFCGMCSKRYAAGAFWICCDKCEKWFHGKCVKMTQAKANYVKQYNCPSCSSNKRARA